MKDFSHVPVMLYETVDALITDTEGVYVDGTIGGGGHSEEICRRLTGEGRLIGLDQDDDAIAAARARLSFFKERADIIRSSFADMDEVLDERGIGKVDGIMLDLGVSSFQLDEAARGFSYMNEDAPLDMRMDRRQSLTAADILKSYSEQDLYRIIRDYGEEPFAKNIAKHIVRARSEKPIETAGDLNAIIRAAIPAKMRASGGHPSKRTFQALRIEVNRELTILADSLDAMIDRLKEGGRLCVITFHSLEDRTVKEAFRRNENPCTCPPGFPVCVCGKVPKGKMMTRKPILPGEDEIKSNSRSKSAKLRVFIKQTGEVKK
ncbi:MAG: 16S rRNA (cytosine(1402)-N(4))-methyltransferase RsmH [Clostridiales bacterium]|nr:16S rRNA (cytosine(1402)-N(4))-methyltransferase RsmH [Clostridiales bacterium]